MSQENQRQIIVVHANRKIARHLLHSTTCKELDSWIYLGKNVLLFTDIDNIIGNRINHVDTGEILQDAARNLRQKYIDFIGGLSKKEDIRSWLLSPVAEKNPFISDLFLNLCYLEALDRIINETSGNLYCFCEEPALIQTLIQGFKNSADIKTNLYDDSFISFSGSFRIQLASIINSGWFVVRFFFRIFFSRIVRAMKVTGEEVPKDKPLVAIHSWADQRSFVNDREYHNTYLGMIEKILESAKCPSFFIIDVLPTIFFPKALGKLIGLRIRWTLFEDFLEFSDIGRELRLAYRRKSKENAPVYFSGHDVSPLISWEYLRDRSTARAALSALYYFAMRKMAQKFSVRTYLYTFENHMWEKLAISGIREASINTAIIGYAHATVNRMELSYSLSQVEKSSVPIPDSILVNGIRAKDILLESGFDTDIQIIGSLRYGNLTAIKKISNLQSLGRVILVVLSASPDRSIEMIQKCVSAFTRVDGLTIIFKIHPTIKPARLTRFVKNLPKKFVLSTKPIGILYGYANLVIYSDSSAAVEAASLGIPVLHLKSGFTIDMNIFESDPIIPSVYSPDQLCAKSIGILDGDYPSDEAVQRVIQQIFSPVDNMRIQQLIARRSGVK